MSYEPPTTEELKVGLVRMAHHLEGLLSVAEKKYGDDIYLVQNTTGQTIIEPLVTTLGLIYSTLLNFEKDPNGGS